MNTNPDVRKSGDKKKTGKLCKLHKWYTTFLVSTLITALSSVTVFAAPAGINTGKFNNVVNIVFWILQGALAIYGGVAVYQIAKGHNDEDPRTMNKGIVGVVVVAMCVAASIAIKKLFFT